MSVVRLWVYECCKMVGGTSFSKINKIIIKLLLTKLKGQDQKH